MGATSDYGYRGVGGERSRWDLGYQGTKEFLAVLTVTHIVSTCSWSKTAKTYSTEEVANENDHHTPTVVRLYLVEVPEGNSLPLSIIYSEICCSIKDGFGRYCRRFIVGLRRS